MCSYQILLSLFIATATLSKSISSIQTNDDISTTLTTTPIERSKSVATPIRRENPAKIIRMSMTTERDNEDLTILLLCLLAFTSVIPVCYGLYNCWFYWRFTAAEKRWEKDVEARMMHDYESEVSMVTTPKKDSISEVELWEDSDENKHEMETQNNAIRKVADTPKKKRELKKTPFRKIQNQKSSKEIQKIAKSAFDPAITSMKLENDKSDETDPNTLELEILKAEKMKLLVGNGLPSFEVGNENGSIETEDLEMEMMKANEMKLIANQGGLVDDFHEMQDRIELMTNEIGEEFDEEEWKMLNEEDNDSNSEKGIWEKINEMNEKEIELMGEMRKTDGKMVVMNDKMKEIF